MKSKKMKEHANEKNSLVLRRREVEK